MWWTIRIIGSASSAGKAERTRAAAAVASIVRSLLPQRRGKCSVTGRAAGWLMSTICRPQPARDVRGYRDYPARYGLSLIPGLCLFADASISLPVATSRAAACRKLLYSYCRPRIGIGIVSASVLLPGRAAAWLRSDKREPHRAHTWRCGREEVSWRRHRRCSAMYPPANL